MPRFQIVLRVNGPDRVSLHDTGTGGGMTYQGCELVDGAVITAQGHQWRVRADDLSDLPRFVCTPIGRDPE